MTENAYSVAGQQAARPQYPVATRWPKASWQPTD